MIHQCPECEFTTKKKSQLLQHQRAANHWRRFRCDTCGALFTRKTNLDRHKEKHRDTNSFHCHRCGRSFSRPDNLRRHLAEKHQIGGGLNNPEQENNDPRAKRLKKDDDPRRFYTISKVKEQRIQKFRTIASVYKISFKDIEVTDDVLRALKTLFSTILKDLTKGAKAEDLVRLTVQSPSLDYPITIPFLRVPELTVDRFMAEIERVLQSHEEFTIDDSLTFDVTLVDMPIGGALKRCRYVDTEKFLSDKRCIIRIMNDDELCCARAIITAKAKIDNDEQWNYIRQGRSIQKVLAKELHDTAGVPIGQCGIEEITKFQEVLRDYQIHVVSRDHFNGIIFAGPEAEKKIYLYYHDQHYDVITSMPAFLSKNYYCTECNKGYDHKEKHKCNSPCNACRKVHDPCSDNWICCDRCNRFFHGQECFDFHKQTTVKGNSTCSNIYRCTDCGKTVNKKWSKKPHTCGDSYCNVCKDFFPDGHRCYMMPENHDADENSTNCIKTYIFFDFECTQDDLVQCDMGYSPDVFGKCQHCLKSSCGSYEHKPNLCVAQKVCTLCLNNDDECQECGQREKVFSGLNASDDFCQWLFSEQNFGVTVLCHNFQGYDSYPILQYLYKNGIVPTIVPNGAKVMCLTLTACKIKMIDSINFLPMALAKFPDTFGFEELKKGYFPHLFNRKKNQTTVLPRLPDLSYYNPDAMKSEDRDTFLKWYESHKNDSFDFQQELLAYCKSDVDILRRCCLKFRGDFINITGIDPFEKSITIASACQRVFRKNYLQENTIGIIPAQGYNPEQNQSTKALQWVKYLSYVRGRKIQHAKNGGEKVIGPYLVDGYYEAEDGRKVVLEFHGDFWHGNPSKFSRNTINPMNHMTMGNLYDKTLEKQRYLEGLGYVYECIWESDFDEQCHSDPEMKSFIDHLDMSNGLEPRDAFYGGRTEAYTLYKEASPEQDIDYYDVTSLYPWVNKTGKIPVGHPDIITENFEDLDHYEGLVKCKILPPRGLFLPILPC